jgi:hypothetical protein
LFLEGASALIPFIRPGFTPLLRLFLPYTDLGLPPLAWGPTPGF